MSMVMGEFKKKLAGQAGIFQLAVTPLEINGVECVGLRRRYKREIRVAFVADALALADATGSVLRRKKKNTPGARGRPEC
jgi:hypothetical protein